MFRCSDELFPFSFEKHAQSPNLGFPVESGYPASAVTTRQTTQEFHKPQQLRHLNTAKFYLLLPRSHILPLPSLHSFLHSVRSMKKTSNTWSQGSSYFLHGFHNIRRASEADRRTASFRPRDLIFRHFHVIWEAVPPRLSVPDLCGPSTLPSFFFCLFGSRNEAYDDLSRVFASDLPIT